MMQSTRTCFTRGLALNGEKNSAQTMPRARTMQAVFAFVQQAGFLSSCIFNQTFCVLSCAALAECASASFLRNRLAKMEKCSALVASLGAHFYLPIFAARKATSSEKGVKARSTRNLLRNYGKIYYPLHCWGRLELKLLCALLRNANSNQNLICVRFYQFWT